MSDTYTKLFSSITESTIVSEPVATRWAWVTMLAMANAHGQVYASIPGMARRANLTVEQIEAALATFYAPDKYSRTKDNEGRRITDIDGGWLLLNHAKYAAVRNAEERREYKREWDQKNRSKQAGESDQSDSNPTESDNFRQTRQTRPNPTEAATPTPTPTPVNQKLSPDLRPVDVRFSESDPLVLDGQPVTNGPKRKPVPFDRIVDLYHQKLPMCPRVEKVTKTRAGYMRQRWADDMPSLSAWGNYFDDVAKSLFLTGKAPGRDGKPPFVASLEWLCKDSNFTKVLEGNYHR